MTGTITSSTAKVKARKATTSKKTAKSAAAKVARLEARIDPELKSMITEAAGLSHMNQSQFITESLREAAAKVLARAEATLMAPEVFERMMAALDTADASPQLAALVNEPRQIAW
jgi:uncharacterized protein (DUF1778 family)